ncbi:DUF983 domain-containing protein [Aureivirga sp. CE67]|uniref:DUF983 domain-containing protein n=1 Tax=Aureivirga sp. CE67 TaxID=1788983 RepID=UPI0018CB163E|nr:DUF983 domain-containing protein [Aureivirga sp. CE67]
MSDIVNIAKGVCPNCQKGKMFKVKGSLLKFKFPQMHDFCPSCNHKFEREPGFFYGAMYVSYGVSVAEGIATYVISSMFFEEKLDFRIMIIIAVVLLSMTVFNYRISRVIWAYIFKPKKRMSA